MKRMLALVLGIVMVLSLATSAFAYSPIYGYAGVYCHDCNVAPCVCDYDYYYGHVTYPSYWYYGEDLDEIYGEDGHYFIDQYIDQVVDYVADKYYSYGACGYYYVTASALNVRTGASTSAKILNTVKKGDAVKVIAFVDGWAKIEWNGGSAYVYAKYLSGNEVVGYCYNGYKGYKGVYNNYCYNWNWDGGYRLGRVLPPVGMP